MRMMMGIVMIAMVGCGGEADEPCDTAAAGGTFPIYDGTPGAYVVEIQEGETHLVAGFAAGVADPTPAPPEEAWAFIAPERWLRLTTTDGVVRVQDCRRGGTRDGDCAEIGPPNGQGRIVAYRDGVQIFDELLWTPSFAIAPVDGCPLLFEGHIERGN